MLTDQQADAIYQDALDALNEVIRAREGVSDAQKDEATEKRTNLTLKYIGKAMANIEERTRKFQSFIDEMQAVIEEFDPGTSIAGVVQLKEVVDEAAAALKTARGEEGSAGGDDHGPRMN